MRELTHKQECIKGYFDNIKKIESAFDCDVTKLAKGERKYLRYKFACVDNYPNCDQIANNKTLDDFTWCQARCQYSYENRLRTYKSLGANFG